MICACNGDAEEDGDDEEGDHVSAVALVRQLGQNVLASEVESPGSLGQERNPPRQYLHIFNKLYIHIVYTGSLKTMVGQKLHLRAIKRHQIKF